MNKLLIISLIAGILFIGIGITLEATSIAKTDFTFSADKISPPTKETPQEYATRMLSDVSMSEITCDTKSGYCKFSIMRNETPIYTTKFYAEKKTEKEILAIRDKETNRILNNWLNEQAKKDEINIGGAGNVVVKK